MLAIVVDSPSDAALVRTTAHRSHATASDSLGKAGPAR